MPAGGGGVVVGHHSTIAERGDAILGCCRRLEFWGGLRQCEKKCGFWHFLFLAASHFIPPPPPNCELAPMALCQIHVAGCGEHLPAWRLRDDRIPGTDQAVRGGRHGQKLHSGFPPRQMDARGSADACLS